MGRPVQETFDFGQNEPDCRRQLLGAVRDACAKSDPLTLALLAERFCAKPHDWPVEAFRERVGWLVDTDKVRLNQDGSDVDPWLVLKASGSASSLETVFVVVHEPLSREDISTIIECCEVLFGQKPPENIGDAAQFVRAKLREWKNRIENYFDRTKNEGVPGQKRLQDQLAALRTLTLYSDPEGFLSAFMKAEDQLAIVAKTLDEYRKFFEHYLPNWRTLKKALAQFDRNKDTLKKDAKAGPALRALLEMGQAKEVPQGLGSVKELIFVVEAVNRPLETKKLGQAKKVAVSQIEELLENTRKRLKAAGATPDICNQCLLPLRQIMKRIQIEKDRLFIPELLDQAHQAFDEALDLLNQRE